MGTGVVDLLLLIQSLDHEAEHRGLQDREWEYRYKLEDELNEIYSKEEVMWQIRVGEKWLFNTAFFHGVANGRKRKCLSKSLEDNGDIVTDIGKLKDMITKFYKKLFGSERQSNIRLHSDLWKQNSKVTMEENVELTKPFTLKELEEVVHSLRDDSAPGPDGFSSVFSRCSGTKLKIFS